MNGKFCTCGNCESCLEKKRLKKRLDAIERKKERHFINFILRFFGVDDIEQKLSEDNK